MILKAFRVCKICRRSERFPKASQCFSNVFKIVESVLMVFQVSKDLRGFWKSFKLNSFGFSYLSRFFEGCEGYEWFLQVVNKCFFKGVHGFWCSEDA